MAFNEVSNLTPRTTLPPTLEPAKSSFLEPASPKPLQGPNVTVLGTISQIEGPGGSIQTILPAPNVGLADVPLNEVLQQLESVGTLPLPLFVLSNALNEVADAASANARELKALAKNPDAKAEQVKTAATTTQDVAQQATTIESALRDMIENSTYPNFSEFLKELVAISQQLREQATKAKMAAIESNYQLMMDAADQMLLAADEAKASREAEIEASKKEAWGQIASGLITIGVTALVGGLTKNAQLGGTMGQAASSISSGATTIIVSQDKKDSSDAQYASDLANVAKERLQAAAKLIEQQTTTAEDLREIARGLRDMILKLYQDFINSQNEVIRRANV
jgi:hypothetical protein